ELERRFSTERGDPLCAQVRDPEGAIALAPGPSARRAALAQRFSERLLDELSLVREVAQRVGEIGSDSEGDARLHVQQFAVRAERSQSREIRRAIPSAYDAAGSAPSRAALVGVSAPTPWRHGERRTARGARAA